MVVLCVFLSVRVIGCFVRINVLQSAGVDDRATERGGVDGHILDTVGEGPGSRAAVFGFLTAVVRLVGVDGLVTVGARGLVRLGPVCDSVLGQDIGNVAGLIGHVGAAFFGIADGVGLSVRVSSVTVAVASVGVSVVVEQEQAEDVGGKTEAADDQDELGLVDLLRLDETLNGFKEDGQAQGDEEDAVDEGSECFGALPLGECKCGSLVRWTSF